MLYDIITYDVWGNARDGFNVNQAFKTGDHVELSGDESDMAINRRLGVRGIEWEGDPEYTLYGTLKRNGMPTMELQRVTQE